MHQTNLVFIILISVVPLNLVSVVAMLLMSISFSYFSCITYKSSNGKINLNSAKSDTNLD